jgi:hypothetical protein
MRRGRGEVATVPPTTFRKLCKFIKNMLIPVTSLQSSINFGKTFDCPRKASAPYAHGLFLGGGGWQHAETFLKINITITAYLYSNHILQFSWICGRTKTLDVYEHNGQLSRERRCSLEQNFC